jgi:hypothetical protein
VGDATERDPDVAYRPVVDVERRRHRDERERERGPLPHLRIP